MTRSDLQLLMARVAWLQHVVRCLGAFETCYWHRDMVRAEQALHEALESEPKV